MSDARRIWLYGAAALVFTFEAVVFWWMLHPDVPPGYRAYYIDHTTTCLDQPVAGGEAFGTGVVFNSETAEVTRPMRVCGWEGPVGDGLHAVGTSARLRLVGMTPASNQRLIAELSAVRKDDIPQHQRVDVLIDGAHVGEWTIRDPLPQSFAVDVPAAALGDGRLEVEFRFPDAVQMGRTDPETRRRSIKLRSVAVLDATGAAAPAASP